ncbi:hypothetical protein MAMMFC1_01523 [Methylomusa anaerophila]|uniref:Uncharacterized protein n=1 Tax=Methylomusa anaerophila TaxID=1930071 RepID=A0A348AIF8_9FIRM|nr:hypothetical protein MAMMFC1_01523 [Methylomusa anaerophila]
MPRTGFVRKQATAETTTQMGVCVYKQSYNETSNDWVKALQLKAAFRDAGGWCKPVRC